MKNAELALSHNPAICKTLTQLHTRRGSMKLEKCNKPLNQNRNEDALRAHGE
jgi:hypothetical protein